MPIIKAHQPLLHRLPIVYLYADPGLGKTSVGNTCDNPLLIDFDRGADRSLFRQEVLQVDENKGWEEVRELDKAGAFRQYKTIIIDTAKGALDDYIQPWLIKQDAKYGTMKWKLQMFGEMGAEFKRFINSLRRQGCAVFVIAHARKEEERMVPDITGGSGQFLFRLADVIGYMSMKNGERQIQFTPSEYQYCKDCANLGIVRVPHPSEVEFATFGATLVQRVHDAVNSMSIEQQKAIDITNEYLQKIEVVETPEALTELLNEVNTLSDHLKFPLRTAVQEKAKANGWVANKETKCFEAPVKKDEPAAGSLFVEEIPKGKARYETSYQQPDSISTVIPTIKNMDQYAALYMANQETIDADEKLTALLSTKKTELDAATA